MEAPEAVQVPRSLLRADGRSIYQRHGGVRYATRAQLAIEQRLVAQARTGTAPDPLGRRASPRRRPTSRGFRTRWRAAGKKFKIIIPNETA